MTQCNDWLRISFAAALVAGIVGCGDAGPPPGDSPAVRSAPSSAPSDAFTSGTADQSAAQRRSGASDAVPATGSSSAAPDHS
jgi:hypothetical protein